MRLVLDARARAWLRRFPRTNIYSLAEILLLALLAVQCARLVWLVVTPTGPLGDWRPATPGFAGSPSAMLRDFDPFFRLTGGDDKPGVVTSLQLTLFGTRVDEAMGGGSAIIAGPDNVQKSVAVGQEIMPGVKLKAVAFDHVTIDRGGASEELYLPQDSVDPTPPPAAGPPPPPGAPAPPTTVSGVSLNQLRAEIGFIPRVDGGRVSGLVVRPQGSGAAFRQVGLHEGDVVTAIGGRAVSGRSDFDQLAQQYPHGGDLPITVERGNSTVPIVITIASP
ncbi:MAG: type secretory protein PulC [Sphingomonas bacterium]|uniref:type II secretion system protein N n=1 Tax=Sphingomonas bacterium TaxID=1895847 RepID=UPI0026360475|nr:type II secretion system protein N [Sphingomonas bacterium]MDB5712208.1 type secretory protein PulC [Sphingomonas bacterium]